MELEDHIHIQVTSVMERGEKLTIDNQLSEALILYNQALALIPEPAIAYDASTWIEIKLGDILFKMNDYENALKHYAIASDSEEGIDDAYVWFCLGRVNYFLQDVDHAIMHFKQSFNLEGAEFFENEDPVYLMLIGKDKNTMGLRVQTYRGIENKWLPPDWNKN